MKSLDRLVVGLIFVGVLIAAVALQKIFGYKSGWQVFGIIIVGVLIAAMTLFEKIFGHKRDAAGKSRVEQEGIEPSTRLIFWTLRRNRLVFGIIIVGVLIGLYACYG